MNKGEFNILKAQFNIANELNTEIEEEKKRLRTLRDRKSSIISVGFRNENSVAITVEDNKKMAQDMYATYLQGEEEKLNALIAKFEALW